MYIALMRHLGALPLLVAPGAMYAQATLHVPADYPTIQSAINASSDGDTVLVAPGEYYEQLKVFQRNITLRSSHGAAQTIVDNTNLELGGHPALLLHGPTEAFVLQGFTLRGPTTAVHLSLADATVIDNVFENNSGSPSAVWGYGSSTLLARNLFHDNERCTNVAEFVGTAFPDIVNNVFDGNRCTALYVSMAYEDFIPFVFNNTFVNNDVAIDTVPNSTHVFVNNLLYGNKVGLRVDDDYHPFYTSKLTWQHNLVFGNDVDFEHMDDPTGTDGNVSADPLLRGLSVADYHVGAGSPAIDAGFDAPDVGQDPDFYGVARVFDGNGDGGPQVDIGAIEFHTAPPTVELNVSPGQVGLSEPATLTWSSTDATECTASGPWSGARAASGSEQVSESSPSRPVYAIECAGPGGRSGKSVELIVGEILPVAMSFDPPVTDTHHDSTLTWDVPGAAECTASGAWSGPVAPSGTLKASRSIEGDYVYGISCTGPTGTGLGSATLSVWPSPYVYISPNLVRVNAGESVTLTWTTRGVTSCEASRDWSGDKPINGSETLRPPRKGYNNFRLVCYGPVTGANWTTQVEVLGGGSSSGSPSPFALLWLLVAAWLRSFPRLCQVCAVNTQNQTQTAPSETSGKRRKWLI